MINTSKVNKLIQSALLSGLLILSQLVAASPIKPNHYALVGTSSLSVYFFHVFDSGLYTSTGSYEFGQTEFLLELNYQRKISKDQLIKQTQKEWRAMSLEHQSMLLWVEQLESSWPDVKKGDRLGFYVDEVGHGHFYFNDTYLVSIQDPDFSQYFVAIWLSPETTQAKHRAGLLGQG